MDVMLLLRRARRDCFAPRSKMAMLFAASGNTASNDEETSLTSVTNPAGIPRKYLRTRDGSGCICDIASYADFKSDWNIAQLVGIATYGQLLDAAPGLFQPFPDIRANGDSSSSIAPLFGMRTPIAPESRTVPFPPNVVSTYLADGHLTPADLKRLLINAANGHGVDPRIEALVGSSPSYKSPELSLSEIVLHLALLTAVVATVSSIILVAISKRWDRVALRTAMQKLSGMLKFYGRNKRS